MSDGLDLHAGLDGIQEDMASHQRRFGEVTAEENRKLATQLIERIDREAADEKPAPIRKSEPGHVTPKQVGGIERKEGKHGAYLMSSTPVDDTKTRQATGPEHWFMSHAMPRAMLLLTKQDTGPLGQASWRSRTLAVMEIHSRVGTLRMANRHVEAKMLERRFMHEFLELLEASSTSFGDWKKDPDRRIQVG